MGNIIIARCLKCGKEYGLYASEVDKRIQEGIVCPHCNYVHAPSDFVRLASRGEKGIEQDSIIKDIYSGENVPASLRPFTEKAFRRIQL